MSETATIPTTSEAFAAAKAEHAPETPAAVTAAAPAESTPAAREPAAESHATGDLLSDDDYTALETAHKEPAAFRAALQATLREKTAAVAEQRTSLGSLADWADELANPAMRQQALTDLAETYGFTLTPAKAAEASTPVAAQTAAHEVAEAIKGALGPELDFLAGPLQQVIEAAVQPAIAKAVAEAISPVETRTKELLTRAATEQRDQVLRAFADKHPDYTTHEKAMSTLMDQLPPGKAIAPLDYLEHIYALATRTRAEGDTVKKIVTRMTAAAHGDEGRSTPAPNQAVTERAPDTNDRDFVRKAFDAAKRGVRWE